MFTASLATCFTSDLGAATQLSVGLSSRSWEGLLASKHSMQAAVMLHARPAAERSQQGFELAGRRLLTALFGAVLGSRHNDVRGAAPGPFHRRQRCNTFRLGTGITTGLGVMLPVCHPLFASGANPALIQWSV